MALSRIRLLVVAFFVTALAATFIKSSLDRQKVERLVVGSWSLKPEGLFEEPLVIHLRSDHTYIQESTSDHDAKKGNWNISSFPTRIRLILSSFRLFSNFSSDGAFELDLTRRTMTDRSGVDHFEKISENPDLPLSDAEKAILGAWESSVEQVHNYAEHTFLFSDHQYVTEAESFGSWHLDGKQLSFESIDGMTGGKLRSNLVVDSQKGLLKYVKECYSLHRPPLAVPKR
jgi:hypothetical protein